MAQTTVLEEIERAELPVEPAADDESARPAKKRKLQGSNMTVDYRNGLFLAPMVRIGTLPTRLLALEYGASLVWGPEIVDRAIIDAERTQEPSGVVRFVKDGRSIWETHPLERSRLIYQVGSAHVEQALDAAKKVEDLVAGVDLNCGCPKSFSIHGGMGAELLKVPDKLCAILRNLVDHLSVPVSCKIRLLPDQAATISLVKRIAETGIVNLTVHCRTQEMRPREPALLHRLREIVDSLKPYGIPVCANGDCFRFEDIERIKQMTGVISIMIARGAESNVSVFRSAGPLDPVDEIVPRYLQVARAVSHPWGNCKYVLQAMDLAVSPVTRPKKQRNALAQRYMQAKSIEDACKAFDVEQSKSLEELLPHLVERNRISQVEEASKAVSTVSPKSAVSIEMTRCAPAVTLEPIAAEIVT